MKGSPEARFWAKVNKSEGCWNWIAGKSNTGYGNLKVGSIHIGAHRFSYEMTNGPIPDGMFIDHVCRNRACVNPEHLRLATRKQNGEHRDGAQANNNSSGVRGVIRAPRGRWQGRVMHNKERYSAGSFGTIAEAEAAVIALRNDLFTHNNLDRPAS